ncbi:CvpA family protein [SAR202 cluster bacterium AC-647-N09_OGT_505m]|nr:CvpA family protein [SAR202 cluster bacterium AC-647-N09_OGT_505m]
MPGYYLWGESARGREWCAQYPCVKLPYVVGDVVFDFWSKSSMNWLDIVIIAVWAFGFIVGWRMGLFGAIFTTGGLIVGVLLAARFSDNVSEIITDSVSSDSLVTVLAYGIILLAVLVTAQVIRTIVKSLLKLVFLGWVETVGGLALSLIMGVVLSGSFITVLARYSSDLPSEFLNLAPGEELSDLPLELLIERAGIQEKLNTALVESNLVPMFLDIRDAVPGHALGFVPDDFKVALDVLEVEIASK